MINTADFEELNDIISINNKTVIDRIVLISLEKIEENSKNFYELSTIDQLIESIKTNGLYNPIIVYQIDDDKYRIISGHQRFNACKKLNYTEIKAIVINKFETVEEEEIAIIETNRQRVKTKEEKYEEIQKVKALYTKLKKEGIKKYQKANINKLTAEVVGVSAETVKKVTAEKKVKSKELDVEEKINKEVAKLNKINKSILNLAKEDKVDYEFLEILKTLDNYISVNIK